jgi:hypothetical protein
LFDPAPIRPQARFNEQSGKIRLFGSDLGPVDAPSTPETDGFFQFGGIEIRIWISADVGQADVGIRPVSPHLRASESPREPIPAMSLNQSIVEDAPGRR